MFSLHKIYQGLLLAGLATVLALVAACAPAPTAAPAATNAPAATIAPAATNAPAATSAPAPTTASAGGEVPTLDYVYFAFHATPEDLQLVEDAANAILVPKIGAKIKLHPFTASDITTKAPLILQSGDPCDLMSMNQFNPFNNGVSTGGLLALDDLLPKDAPKTWASLSPEIWNAAKVNGKIYGSINFTGDWANYTGMWMRQDLLDKYKFDWAATKKLEDWEPYFDQLVKNEPGVTPLLSTDGYWGRQWFPNYYGYDPVDVGVGAPQSQGIIAVKADDKTRKIVAAPWTDAYKQAVTLARKWYNAGYFLKTTPTDSEMSSKRTAKQFSGFEFPRTAYFSTQAMAANEWSNIPIITQHLQEHAILTTGAIQNSITAVCAVSKHPDLAVKYIEEVNHNADLYNLLNFGVQGKHWVWVDQSKNIIGYPPGVNGQTVGYNANAYWEFGDRHQLYLFDPTDVGVFDRIDVGMKSAIPSPILGFTPDRTPVQNEIAAVASAAKQYCDPLDRGQVDVDSGLAQCQAKLKEAGIDKIVSEFQSQVDAWAKANGQ